jgi:hypothetical protein
VCRAGQSDTAGEAFAARYKRRVLSVFVYCRETHPLAGEAVGGLALPKDGETPSVGGMLLLSQTRSREERAERARLFRRQAKLFDWVLVDEEGEQSVQRLYNAATSMNSVFVVDGRGRVAYKEKGVPVSRVDECLETLLGR